MKEKDHLSLAKDLVQQNPGEAGAHALIYIAEFLAAIHPQKYNINVHNVDSLADRIWQQRGDR